eukprot:3955667-Pyramimonas_sp.AAC.1
MCIRDREAAEVLKVADRVVQREAAEVSKVADREVEREAAEYVLQSMATITTQMRDWRSGTFRNKTLERRFEKQ